MSRAFPAISRISPELAAIQSIDIDVHGMADVHGVEDLDLDGRDEAFPRPADLVVGGHRVVIGEGDIGHAEPAGLRIKTKRVDLPGRDDVVGMKRVDMEVGRLPALGQQARGPRSAPT